VDQALFERAKRAGHLIELVLRVLDELDDLPDLVGRRFDFVSHPSFIPRNHCHVVTFELQFPAREIEPLAGRFPGTDDSALLATGAAARARGHYTRAEFIEVCAWKTARSRPKVAANAERAVIGATARALGSSDETARIGALLELHGVGVPTASTLLYCAFPDEYPILDVRALESLGVGPRSSYPVSFWLAYLEACRALARATGVSLRTLDKALWQHSKELSVAAVAGRDSAGAA
jgi:hypothetical protein